MLPEFRQWWVKFSCGDCKSVIASLMDILWTLAGAKCSTEALKGAYECIFFLMYPQQGILIQQDLFDCCRDSK